MDFLRQRFDEARLLELHAITRLAGDGDCLATVGEDDALGHAQQRLGLFADLLTTAGRFAVALSIKRATMDADGRARTWPLHDTASPALAVRPPFR